MDTLFARYFDGELDENEARNFMQAVESDPELEKELRAYEHVLELAKKMPTPKAPPGFTRGVMAEITAGTSAERGVRRRRFFAVRWPQAAVAAAAVALAFAGGWWAAQGPGRPEVTTEQAGEVSQVSTGETVPASIQQAGAPGNGYHYVRLVYVPRELSVKEVNVVGSFNNWDPRSIPMRREGDVFSTILYLPPGSYEYMFVVDGRDWVTDPAAAEVRDDGFGGTNAVLDVYM